MPSEKSGPWLCANCCECMFNEGKDTGIDDGAKKPLVSSKGRKKPPKKAKPTKKSSGPGIAMRSEISAYTTAVESTVSSSSTSTILSDASGWSVPSNQYNSPASTVIFENYMWEPEIQYNDSVKVAGNGKYHSNDDLTYNDSTAKLRNEGQLHGFHTDFKEARGYAKYNRSREHNVYIPGSWRPRPKDSITGLNCHCKYCEGSDSSLSNNYIPAVHGMPRAPDRYRRTSLCYQDNRNNTENLYNKKAYNSKPRPFKPMP